MECSGRTVMNPSKLRMSTGGSVREGGTYTTEREKIQEYVTPRGFGGWTRYDMRRDINSLSTFVTSPDVIPVTVTS